VHPSSSKLQDLVAGLSADPAAVQVGTPDDRAVRPSDHNLLFVVLELNARRRSE